MRSPRLAFCGVRPLVSVTIEMPVCDRIDFPAYIPKKSTDGLAWLKLPSAKEAEAPVGRELRRFEFHFTKDNALRGTLRFLLGEYRVEMTATNKA